MSGTFGYRFFRMFSLLYSGRKSCPQDEIQCASSTANIDTFNLPSNLVKSAEFKRSGEIYNNFKVPFKLCSIISFYSWADNELLRNSAAIPFALSASTWSFINEIKGEITIVTPSNINAGI